MEIDHVDRLSFEDSTLPIPWNVEELRKVRYEPVKTSLITKNKNREQTIYRCESEEGKTFQIRRCKGFPLKSPLYDFIWISSRTSNDLEIFIAVDPRFVFEETGALINQKIIEWNEIRIAPIFEISTAVLNTYQQLLDIEMERFTPLEGRTAISIENFFSMDQAGSSQLYIFGDLNALDYLERRIRDYSEQFWKARDFFGKRIQHVLNMYLYPRKRIWLEEELKTIEVGDLLDMENFRYSASTQHMALRGNFRYQSISLHNKYEVYLVMDAENTRVQFGTTEIGNATEEGTQIAPHEQIELEIHVGRTRVIFNELCTIQEGTLIELREHSLPQVTLTVNGSPLMEGELVQFQEQLMVQITKIL